MGVRDVATELYCWSLDRFDREHPGRGFDPLDERHTRDWPVAYALFVIAEARRFRATGDEIAAQSAGIAARWLLDNAQLSPTGRPGFGVPLARDTFRLGKPVAAWTPHLVPTAFAIEALLDVLALPATYGLEDAQTREAGSLADELAATFAEELFEATSHGTVFRYSTAPHHPFHVINANALFARQLLRLSQVNSGDRRSVWSNLAEDALRYTLEMTKWEDDVPTWRYYGMVAPTPHKARRPNDLLHEAYTISALTGGPLGHRPSTAQLRRSLARFVTDTDIRELPVGYAEAAAEGRSERRQARLRRTSRLWGVGAALRAAAQLRALGDDPEATHLIQRLLDLLIVNYAADDGWKVVPSERPMPFPRHESHLLDGLSAVAFGVNP